jgi:hypothetical protein
MCLLLEGLVKLLRGHRQMVIRAIQLTVARGRWRPLQLVLMH